MWLVFYVLILGNANSRGSREYVKDSTYHRFSETDLGKNMLDQKSKIMNHRRKKRILINSNRFSPNLICNNFTRLFQSQSQISKYYFTAKAGERLSIFYVASFMVEAEVRMSSKSSAKLYSWQLPTSP